MIGAMQPVSSQVKRLGKDCALLFAVNDYKYMAELNNPVQNARNIAAELEDR